MNPNQTNTQRWHKKDFVRPNTVFSGQALTDNVTSLHTPLQYFQMFVSEDLVQALATNTNEYSIQNVISVNAYTMEIQKVLGLKMGLVQMAVTHTFWDTDTWHPTIADVMSLLTALHFCITFCKQFDCVRD